MPLLTAKRDPSWIGCIDFGTALSKFAMVKAIDRAELQPEHFLPLSIAVRPGFLPINRYLLPSVVFVSGDRLLFGQEAEQAALRAEDSGRQAFVSPKQYLSTHDAEDLDQPLPREIDPTTKFTARDLLTLFLAHLIERAGDDAKQKRLPWPVPLRIARPAWKARRARDGEKILKGLVRDGFALVDKLGSKLSSEGGLPHRSAVSALRNLPPAASRNEKNIFKLTARGEASVLEATAVATGSIRDTGRRVVAVADIGGGTSDFGAFMTGLPRRHVLGEITDSSGVLHEAGDYLDMQLRRYILAKAGLLADDPAARGVANRLKTRARVNKEELFRAGSLAVQLGDGHAEDVTLEEFLADRHVVGFSERLRACFHKTLSAAVLCAQSHTPPTGEKIPVEIMLTGGGHDLPIVRALYEKPSVPWTYTEPAPDLAERPEDTDFHAVRRQMVVAIGGAVRDLPVQTAPLRLQPSFAE